MLTDEIKAKIQSGYRQFLDYKELKPRQGQKQMIAAIANSLTNDDPDHRLSVIEAGTGTGKTVSYLIATLPIARALDKTVIVYRCRGCYRFTSVDSWMRQRGRRLDPWRATAPRAILQRSNALHPTAEARASAVFSKLRLVLRIPSCYT